MRVELGSVRDDAYHITAAANMASIAANGFRVDRRGVLGTGAYFDLGSKATGWLPARERYPGLPLIVFRCEIVMGRVLDLDDEEMRRRFIRFQRGYVRDLGREEARHLGQGGHLDAFLEALSNEGQYFDTIKRTFVTDARTRVAVRDPLRVRVLHVWTEGGAALEWPPQRI